MHKLKIPLAFVRIAEAVGHFARRGERQDPQRVRGDGCTPMPVESLQFQRFSLELSAALFARFSSRGTDDYADKLLSAMRFAFGGHLEKKA